MEEFRDRLDLTGILGDPRASLIFGDAGCFGGHALTFAVGADGKLDEEQYLWG